MSRFIASSRCCAECAEGNNKTLRWYYQYHNHRVLLISECSACGLPCAAAFFGKTTLAAPAALSCASGFAVGSVRGEWQTSQDSFSAIPKPMFAPKYLLENSLRDRPNTIFLHVSKSLSFLLFLRKHLPKKIDELRHTIHRNLTGLFLCILCTPLAFTDESTGRRIAFILQRVIRPCL